MYDILVCLYIDTLQNYLMKMIIHNIVIIEQKEMCLIQITVITKMSNYEKFGHNR